MSAQQLAGLVKSLRSVSSWNWIASRLDTARQLDFDRWAVVATFAVVACAALVFVFPGVFVVGLMLNDTFLYTETGYLCQIR